MALLVLGAVLVYAGFQDQSVVDIFTGKPSPHKGDDRGDPLAGHGQNLVSLSDLGSAEKGGWGHFDDKTVAGWMVPALRYARAHGWHGSITSGRRTEAEQRRACAQTSGPCAEPGKSNHQFADYPRGAVDVTDPDRFEEALSGYDGLKPIRGVAGDAVHFSGNGH